MPRDSRGRFTPGTNPNRIGKGRKQNRGVRKAARARKRGR